MKKRLVAVGLIIVMAAMMLTGCSRNVVFKYGDAKVSLEEAEFYARLQQNATESMYGSMFGEQMWSMKLDEDTTVEQKIKSEVINQIKAVKVLNAHADELKVSLTEKEKKKAKENAKTFRENEIGKKIIEMSGADEAMVDRIHEENAIADKVREKIRSKVDKNVTDEEARIKTVYKLVFATTKIDKDGKETELTDKQKKSQLSKAKKAYRALKKGADITALAQQYDIKDVADESYAKGDSLGGAKFEKAVDQLKAGEFTSVIKDKEGYVIAKLITAMDEAKTKENKPFVLENRQNKAFQDQYKKWSKEWDKDWDDKDSINDKLWDSVTFKFGELSNTKTEATTEAK